MMTASTGETRRPGAHDRSAGGGPADAASPANGWTLASYAYAVLAAACMGYFLLDLPIQVADGFTNMTALRGRSLWEVVSDQLSQEAYLRPLLWAHLHVVNTLAGGRYFEWFRGWHAFQVLLLVLLFVAAIRPRRAVDAAVVPLGLAVLIGIHTFAGTVREAFPINTFMTILICCLAAIVVAIGQYRWWHDPAALALFLFAAFTVESGLLVCVIFVAAYLAGARGISRAAVAGLVLLLGGYFYVRFAVLQIGAPSLIERASGYGFSVYEPSQLVAMFGDSPLRFYGYNVATSIASVLFSEPRSGVWKFAALVSQGGRVPWFMLVNIAASTLATAAIGWYVWRRRREWLGWRLDTSDQIVVVFLAVLAANAVISYPYTKDVVMSPAGMCYALAVAVAARDLLARAPRTAAAAVVLMAIVSAGWGVRAAGMHFNVRASGVRVQRDWAYIDQWAARQDNRAEREDAASVALMRQLQEDAVSRHPPEVMPRGGWLEVFDIE